ncbi:histone-lysine n-methyltransferase ashr2 [Phtheirospermum japonicum]|uniref:Histone-lysine n-methyltransferase ashr2 n=1 Tax=Phtheirospermum japonicum TaxID=374723 RepID=A0A830C8K0_9LAMI|nr:histone-lysine n-methyltransferase ashr2 [Phtheirospermum japonicum]
MSDDNGSIKLSVIENKGRALISSRPLMAGEIILKDSPILVYSAAPLAAAANFCSHCFRKISPHSQTTVACPNCSNSSLFCSPQCQSISLSTSHTPFVCQSLIRLAAADSPLLSHHHNHHIRHVQARFLVSAYNLAIVSPPNFQTLLSLQGEPSIDDTSVFLHSLISSVCNSSNLGQLGLSVELTSALLAKDEMNSFGLMEPFNPDNKERSVRAYGIYPRASFFNHDCLPNACRFDYVDSVSDFTNTDIFVRVLHDLPAGREICLSYFPVNIKYSERQKRLKEDYGFTCVCDRCNVESNWSDHEDEMGGEDEDEDMDEDDGNDVEDDVEATGNGGGDDEEIDDFPHAYFFYKYMCGTEKCGGTLAPLPPSDVGPSTTMECHVCGNLSKCED